MSQLDPASIERLAAKYIWWKSPDETLATPKRLIAQVMNIGDYDDIQMLAEVVDEEVLRAVLADAEIGQFHERSWAYWHYRLGLAMPNRVPAMPMRKLG